MDDLDPTVETSPTSGREKRRPATLCVHAGDTVDPATGAVNPPIHPSSTFVQPAVGENLGHVYARGSNPTRDALERCVAELEAGVRALAFASGMAATSCALELLGPGQHVVAAEDLYGGSFRVFETVRRRSAGLDFSYVDLSDPDRLAGAIRPETRMLWLESLTNPLLRVPDVPRLVEIARAHDLIVAVDNTFATPLGQQPLALGADIVMHSSTKYLGGHSDTLSGILVTARPELADELSHLRNSTGAVLSAFESYLVLRGIRTLALRLPRHHDNAVAVARWCAEQPAIERVWHPSLAGHPSRDIAARLLRYTAGVVSIELAGGVDAAHRFMNALSLFAVAEGLAGVESLVGHPSSMSHSGMSPEHRARIGISENLVRLSIGIEDVDDLIGDLAQALATL